MPPPQIPQLLPDRPDLLGRVGQIEERGDFVQVAEVGPSLFQQRRDARKRGLSFSVALEVGLGVLGCAAPGVQGYLLPVGDQERLASAQLRQVRQDGLAGLTQAVGPARTGESAL